jgi:hypothetical protein
VYAIWLESSDATSARSAASTRAATSVAVRDVAVEPGAAAEMVDRVGADRAAELRADVVAEGGDVRRQAGVACSSAIVVSYVSVLNGSNPLAR